MTNAAAVDRFWSKVDRSSPSTCWLWQAATNRKGYGSFMGLGSSRLTHRIAYELMVGPIPPGMQLDHLCRNPPCCNPAHLEPVTHHENLLRGNHPSKRTHCPQGHEYTDANTYLERRVDRWGTRYLRRCRTCRSRGAKAYKQARRLARKGQAS